MHPAYSLHPNLELMTHESRLLRDLMGEPFSRQHVADIARSDSPGRDRPRVSLAHVLGLVREAVATRGASPAPA